MSKVEEIEITFHDVVNGDFIYDYPSKVRVLQDEGYYIAVAYEFHIADFGNTRDEAINNLRAAFHQFMCRCYDNDTLDEEMARLGFKKGDVIEDCFPINMTICPN